jgi:hypothetical protein
VLLDLGPDGTRRTLEGLRASNRETDWITHLVDCWSRVGPALQRALHGDAAGATDQELRQWAALTGRTAFRDFFRVAAARWAAERDADGNAPDAARLQAAYRRGIRTAYRDPIAVGDLAVDGSDLMDMGVPPGPALGGLLRYLLEVVLADPSKNRRDTLLALARDRTKTA